MARVPGHARWAKARLGLGIAAGAVALALAARLLWPAWQRGSWFAEGPRRPQAAWSDEHDSGAWLAGLTEVQRIVHQEYHGRRLAWELRAPGANVRTLRYSFGYVRGRLLLHVLQPSAVIYLGAVPIEIRASRAYYDPQRTEWIFVRGDISQAQRHRRFEQLHWFPDLERLEWPSPLQTSPVFRYWFPQY